MFRKLSIVILVLIIGCKENNQQDANITPTQTTSTNTDSIPFYPYITTIEKEVDSLIDNKAIITVSYTNEKNNTSNKKIAAEACKDYVQKITKYDITTTPIKQFYKEEIFTDLTTSSTIINYHTQNDSLAVKNVSILLDAKNTNTIKRIDIKAIYTSTDSLITENCSWVFNKEFYILRYAEAPSGKSVITKTNLSWEK
ncbi:MAG: hypothetical protein KF781_08265 [Chitinophagaceae bacterium]|nr:hypothetical protein [Chitinophagaceae bacterium]MCW5905750.1 hypothetical protein [Chitinophagaceae bacterium]